MLRPRDIMQTQVVTVSPSLSLAEFELLLERAEVSGMPVVDDAELCGVVSRTDLVRTLADAEGSAEATLAYRRSETQPRARPLPGTWRANRSRQRSFVTS
jgi:CBS domain-containing protein